MNFTAAIADQEHDATTAALAQSMGFSSFGSQDRSSHPSKRRKHNPNVDAVVASPATGANASAVVYTTDNSFTTTAAALASIPGSNNAATQNTEEIDLDESEDEDNGGEREGGNGGAILYPDVEEGTGDHLKAPALAKAQALIDEIVARHGGDGSTGTNEGAVHSFSLPPGGSPGNSGVTLPNRPSPSWGQNQGSLPNIGQEGGHGHDQPLPMPQRQGRGQGQGREPGKPWWEGYYDPASNENPWAALEKKAGLQSRGSWLSRSTRHHPGCHAASSMTILRRTTSHHDSQVTDVTCPASQSPAWSVMWMERPPPSLENAPLPERGSTMSSPTPDFPAYLVHVNPGLSRRSSLLPAALMLARPPNFPPPPPFLATPDGGWSTFSAETKAGLLPFSSLLPNAGRWWMGRATSCRLEQTTGRRNHVLGPLETMREGLCSMQRVEPVDEPSNPNPTQPNRPPAFPRLAPFRTPPSMPNRMKSSPGSCS
ncbi:hypothetical protein SODALDRAFT_374769 [Sodiomyces alkalinus F11]|uniref:Uncharacterized protein n=1 Tax=Sodiomyces alkalinus (strain CBS 110278 / VKM F-3762 / F11) TaxID=1314773 RepID=A0A3N2Q6Q6_SODAK|nr:hypothetical protein SODALDRAFT_374769 [Sodiomyces alkalinus F11]ROT42432.1 hypothetical protein SODALDRAFT_374769 [Sodiomyces alkalinus F11]